MNEDDVPNKTEEGRGQSSGRRHYHERRRREAELRRGRVAELIMCFGFVQGAQARVARELGVSEATVSRDMRNIYWERLKDERLFRRLVSSACKR